MLYLGSPNSGDSRCGLMLRQFIIGVPFKAFPNLQLPFLSDISLKWE